MRSLSVYFSLFGFEVLSRFQNFEIVFDLFRVGGRAAFGFDIMIQRYNGRMSYVSYTAHLCFFRLSGRRDFERRLFP